MKAITRGEAPADPNIYNDIQQKVKRAISESTYPHFLSSDIYMSQLQALNVTTASASMSMPSASNSSHYGGAGALLMSDNEQTLPRNSILPTLDEDAEFSISAKPKLTKDLLLATQERRLEVRPKG